MNKIRMLPLGILVLLCVVGCESKPETVGAAKEFIVGNKRYAGPFQRNVDAFHAPVEDLGPPDQTVEIEANIAGWNPTSFTVKKGQVVELKLIGTDDGVLPAISGITKFTGHGFHIYAYDIWVNGLRAGVERSIKFRASEAGTFPYECVVYCSPDHYKMTGKMTVE